MAAWLAGRLTGVLDEVRTEPAEGAAPIVLGRAAGTSNRSILLYSHYDVQPAETGWQSDPFAPVVTADRITARGVADDKADILARIHALEALRELAGALPCDVIWLSEGAEEVGSPGLAEFVAAHREELAADGCFWESYLRTPDGRPEVGFGARGTVFIELSLTPLASDQHSAFGGVYRSAPIELMAAITSLVDTDGRVLIDALLDGLPRPSDRELEAVAGIETPEAGAVAIDGVRTFVNRADHELASRMVLEPTVNVAGFTSGYTGDGPMTIVPATAVAKIDIRTIAGLSADHVLTSLRDHLDARGFDDVRIEVLHVTPASKSPMDTPFAETAIQAATELYGPPILYPMVAGSGPLHLVADTIGIDIVAPPGSTRMGSNIHGPQESIAISDYLDHVAFTARALQLWGTDERPPR